ADRVESFDECRFDGGAASREGVKHDTTRWSDEADQPSHDREGLHGGVLHTVHVRTLRLRGLRAVEKPGRAASAPVAQICCVLATGVVGVAPPGPALPSAAMAPRGRPVFLVPALFADPCGGVLVE